MALDGFAAALLALHGGRFGVHDRGRRDPSRFLFRYGRGAWFRWRLGRLARRGLSLGFCLSLGFGLRFRLSLRRRLRFTPLFLGAPLELRRLTLGFALRFLRLQASQLGFSAFRRGGFRRVALHIGALLPHLHGHGFAPAPVRAQGADGLALQGDFLWPLGRLAMRGLKIGQKGLLLLLGHRVLKAALGQARLFHLLQQALRRGAYGFGELLDGHFCHLTSPEILFLRNGRA